MNSKTILYVDDDINMLNTGEDILINAGYEVSLAKSGVQAIKLLNKGNRYGLILLDVDMPETLWMEDTNINQKFARNNTETLDIFEPAMHNLFDAASIVIDAILEEKL